MEATLYMICRNNINEALNYDTSLSPGSGVGKSPHLHTSSGCGAAGKNTQSGKRKRAAMAKMASAKASGGKKDSGGSNGSNFYCNDYNSKAENTSAPPKAAIQSWGQLTAEEKEPWNKMARDKKAEKKAHALTGSFVSSPPSPPKETSAISSTATTSFPAPASAGSAASQITTRSKKKKGAAEADVLSPANALRSQK